MSISSTTRKAGPYTGNGVTTALPFSFKVFTASDVRVVRTDLSGVESDLTLTTHYTVALNADQDSNPGGTVNLVTAAATGCLTTLTSQVADLQPVVLTNAGGFYPSVINTALDRLTIMVQQLAEKVSRALQYSISSPLGDSALPTPVANNIIGWNSSANGFQNYAPSDNTLLSATLAASSGSSLVGYLPAGTGAVATTVQAKLRESVSVKDFGAVGDGVNDDTSAINAALSTLIAVGYGTLYFPKGRYLVTSTIQINCSGIYLNGDGDVSTYIVNGSSNSPSISFGNGSTQYYSGGVSNIGFTGKSSVVGISGQMGLEVSKFGQMTLENLRFDASGSALYKGASLIEVSQTIFSKVNCQSALNVGIDLLGCVDLYMTSCRSDANLTGFVLNSCQGMQVANCTAYNNSNIAWYLASGDPVSAPNKNNFFSSCVGDTSGSFNWVINDSRDSMFTNCWASTQISTAVNTFASGFYLATSNCKDIIFTGCIAEYNNSNGFALDSTTSAPSKISFVNCIGGGTGHGNGRSGSGYGVSIGGGANVITGVRIAGGLFSDNATGSINNSSTGDVKITGNPVGYINEQRGTASTSSGTSLSVTFPQQLEVAPSCVNVTPWWDAGSVWVSSITSSGFTINWTTAAGATVYFGWSATV